MVVPLLLLLLPLQVRVMLPGAACLSRRKALLVELPACFDVMGDSGAIGRVVCSRAGAAADGAAAAAAVGLAGTEEEGLAGNAASLRGASGAKAKIASWVAVSRKAGKAPGTAAAAADAAEDEDACSSDSAGGFAEQLSALLLGRSKAAGKGKIIGNDASSGSEIDMSESGMSEDDDSAEKEAADDAGVTAVCLDLKGKCTLVE
jgi:hypothetical protein